MLRRIAALALIAAFVLASTPSIAVRNGHPAAAAGPAPTDVDVILAAPMERCSLR